MLFSNTLQPTMLNRRQFLSASGALAGVAARDSLFASQYDLVIKGGRVLDPAQHLDRVADVAIKDGRIAAIRPNLASSGVPVIDATGKVVTPGLIDIHLHASDPKLPPAEVLSTGVTSMVDGGSRGADNLDDLLKIAQSAPNRLRILLNIAHLGNAPGGRGEFLDGIESADVAKARRAVEQHRDWIVGIKARLSRTIAGEHDLEALQRARQVADPLKIPIMIHIGDTASPLPAILALLRPGDIVTHVYSPPPHGILDDRGRVLPQVREARRRGVLFDIGNGRTGHLTWEVAERAMQEGFLPDTISSDLNLVSRTDQVFDLPNVLSKFLLLGMPLEKVIACATVNAARSIAELGSYGTLRTGASADITLLDLRRGEFEFVDNVNTKRMGRQKLVPYAVLMAGKRV
jgi:dihydroorotase